jgi:hypothetical protein
VSPAGLDLEDVERPLGAAVHSNPRSQAVGWKAPRGGRPGGLRGGDPGQTARLGGDAVRHVVQRTAGAVGKTARSNWLADHGHDPLREPGS